MNKGIDHASGEYLYFLNSGDYLVGDVLGKINFDGTQYIYGDVRLAPADNKTANIQSPFPIDTASIILRDTICHQACFIHSSLFQNQRYRTDYVIISDWIHIVESIILKECSYKHVPICIAEYEGNGISITNGALAGDERMRWRKENIPSFLYKCLLELENTRIELSKYKNAEPGEITPFTADTRKQPKRARKLVLFYYRLSSLFPSSWKRR